ncbi:MAG: ABC transporter ATP-binding protein [Planctomycetes bacterium]|nr:ABC transporter ATP-binding protein [Planctomycetota bacterium]
MLEACLELRAGSLTIKAALDAARGSVWAIAGRNGAGKTTLLRGIAGLARPVAARVAVDGKLLHSTEENIYIPPERREVGYLFQESRLFPNMSVLENVSFGLRARGAHAAEARARGMEYLERFEMQTFANRAARELSGGEARRVALARAMITKPKLILLDEPLGSVDPAARPSIRRDLHREIRGGDCAALIVTHDAADAFTLASHLYFLENGAVTQSGPIADVAAHPRTPFAAEFAGVNIYKGIAKNNTVALDGGAALVAAGAQDGPSIVSIAPSAVAVFAGAPGGSPRNTFQGTIDHLDHHGDRVRLHVRGAVPIRADVTPAAVRELRLAPDVNIWISIKATEVDVYPA